jgi:hypothetical protein
MRLPGARRAKQQNRLPSPRELAGGQHLDLLPFDAAVEQEVEALQRLSDRQSAMFEPHLDPLLLAERRLGQRLEERAERELVAHALLDEVRQTFGGEVPAQAREQRAAAVKSAGRFGTAHDSASTSRAYAPIDRVGVAAALESSQLRGSTIARASRPSGTGAVTRVSDGPS